jgi:aldose sugar dehydrogenase
MARQDQGGNDTYSILTLPTQGASTLRISRILAATLLCLQLQACDAIQYQALKAYMAVEKGLSVEEGAEVVETTAQDFTIKALSDDLEFPWGFDFLPDGRLLVTEKPGRLSIFDTTSGERNIITGVPEVFFKGQGGLLDVVVHPEFENNQFIYLSASVKISSELSTTRVFRFRLNNDALTDELLIFEAVPAGKSKNHFGSALLFDNEGFLFVTMGDRKQRHMAQDLATSLGKIHRFNDDGSIPGDNPFINREDALPSIYSFGHRNPQGITIDRSSGNIWNAEHGPQGGDEINLVEAGANYGWPIITYGEEYGGGKIGEGTYKEGLKQPLHYYVPSIGTAGLAYYGEDALPGWKGDIFVAGLRSFSISRISQDKQGETSDERLLENLTLRARNVKTGPDGLLYVLSENGGILQIAPR